MKTGADTHDWFDFLGLPRKVALEEAALREAFREAGRRWHPDSGTEPDAEAFELANEAFVALSDPARRLRRLLELECGPDAVERGGEFSAELMDLFGAVGAGIRDADDLIRRRGSAGSAVARALLEPEVVSIHASLASRIGEVDRRLAASEGRLAEVDILRADATASRSEFLSLGNSLYRELAFLVRWRRQLQDRIAALF